MPGVESLNHWVGIGTIAMQFIAIVLLAIFALRHRYPFAGELAASITKWGMWGALALTLAATLAAVFYSGVLGFEPCPLCWWQRIFLFPQAILFALAIWRCDIHIADYSIALSIPGLGVALYQHALQILPGSGLPCPATGVSCAQRIIFEFGYITFPLVAASVFALLILLMLFVREHSDR